MKLILVPKKGRLEELVKHAEKLFGKQLDYVVHPQESEDASMILFEKGLRRTAEAVNRQRVQEGQNELSLVEVLIQEDKKKQECSPKNKIRNNIYSLLARSKKPMHGYAIYKKYNDEIGKISSRLVYYHLSRGIREGFFEIVSSEKVKGDFSWGTVSVRKLYGLKHQT